MLGSGMQFGRSSGDDRFYNPAKGRRLRQKDQLRRAQSDFSTTQSPSIKDNLVVSLNREAEGRLGPEGTLKHGSAPAVSPLSNLERFLHSITPSVPARSLSKRTIRGWRNSDMEPRPYFVLGDLWESFKEWSAYGAGVPVILNDIDYVVQYYVPYLSGIQIYVDPLKLSAKTRRPGEECDSDFRDSSSDGSSDSETDKRLKYFGNQHNCHNLSADISLRVDRLSLRSQCFGLQEDCSSDEAESVNSEGCLLFEYLERDLPYTREPLADKIIDLASRFPDLKTLKSCDLLPHSWVSVAWYPIYRIPTGPTLKDLDACFLTYHSLYTSMEGLQSTQARVVTCPSGMDGIPKMSLPVFGLASYKFKGSLWTHYGGVESQLATSLLQAADNRLRLLQVNHPDFLFFSRR